MIRQNMTFLLSVFIVSAPFVFAHETAPALSGFPSPLTVLFSASIVTALLLAIAVFRKSHSNTTKTFLFWSIVVVVGISTLYLAVSTLYTNIASETGGPVHWHADFEIFICGEKQNLPESMGFSNKIGTSMFHHHNDHRIHIEGVIMNLEDVTLAEFFEAIGGELSATSIGIPRNDGSMLSWQNEGSCPDGKQGKLHVFVQQGFSETWKELEDFPDYVISPEADVPPGDRLRFVFA